MLLEKRQIITCSKMRRLFGFTNNRSETRENAFWVLLLRFSGEFDHICICRGFSFVHK